MAINIAILSEFNPAGVKAAMAEFQSLTKATDKAQFALRKMAVPAAAVFSAITIGAYKAAQSASDLNETINKTNVIFGSASKEVQAFAKESAKSLGIANQEALDFSATFGGLGKMAGQTGSDLANFSTDLVTLTADMASFNNANPAEVALALGAALRGESEPIRKYNVLINDAAVKAEAMAMGLYKGTGTLDAQAKVLATHSLIMKQTTDQQGDFNNTIDSAANQQKILTATLKDTVTQIGQGFLPVLEAILPLIVDFANFVENNTGFVVGMTVALGALSGAIIAANIAMAAWKAISIITMGVNWALAASFTAVQIATGVGIAVVIAGVAAFALYNSQMNKIKSGLGAFSEAQKYSNSQMARMSDAGKLATTAVDDFTPKVGGATAKVESFAKAVKEKMGEALDKAKEDLQKAKDEFAAFAKSVSDSVKEAFNFSDALDAGKETGGGFLEGLRSQVSGIVDYAKKIQDLLDRNLSKDALAKVLASGAVAGGAIADQLIAGGQAAIDETNALVDSANSAAEKVGINAAGKWYQGGIDVAEKMVTGIQSALDRMTPKLMEKMDAIAAKMKRTIDIDVRVTETVSRIVSTIAGGGIPKMAEGGIVNRPTLALIGEAGPEAVVPLSKMNSGGSNVNINVTGGLSTSAEIGQSVVNALRAYSRSAGPLALNIA